MVEAFENAGLKNENNLASHLLLQAELDGVICSGPTKGKDYTYALMVDRVAETPPLTKEKSLEKLACTYFSSHGPATLEDFVWWSGLKIADARNAVEMIESNFLSEEIESQTYWFKDLPDISKNNEQSVFLLPAYDEFLISYKDRNASISEAVEKKTISNNGIFRPIIVVNGQVTGIWKRSVKNAKVTIETTFFEKPGMDLREQVDHAAGKFAKFLGKNLKIQHHWP